MRFVIVGAGAIGGWLGAGLAQGGADVSFLARGETLARLRADGLVLISDEARRTYAIPATDDPAAVRGADYVLLALKAQDVAAASETFFALLGPQTLVLTIQNGLPWWFLGDERLQSVDPEGATARAVPAAHALGGVVHASTRLEAPAVVRVNKADRLLIGEPAGGVSARVEKIVALFRDGDIPAVAAADIRAEMWAKLWGNMNMNPISALTQAGASDILGNPLLRELVGGMMREMAEVGKRINIALPMGIDERIAVTGRLGNFRTSMLQDLENGRAMEVEPILGVVIEIAERVGVEAPLSRGVLGLVRQLAANRSRA